MIVSCGAPGNQNPAYGQNKVPYLGDWTGLGIVTKSVIDRNGIARLLLNLEPPQALIDWIIGQKICSNPNWHISVLPLRISGTTIDIVAIKGSSLTCYERSVAVDYFELRNPDKVFPTGISVALPSCGMGREYPRAHLRRNSSCRPYEGLGLEFYDWTREFTSHPYGVCPADILN